MKVPDEVLSFFKQKGIQEYRLVEFNERKGRYCYHFKLNDKDYFLKWNDDAPEHETYKILLCNEIDTYRVLKGNDITPFFYQFNVVTNILVTEYISDVRTLRAGLKKMIKINDIEGTERLIENTFSVWQKCVSILSQSSSRSKLQDNFALFNNYLNSLLCSGPFETERRKFEWLRNRVICKAISLKSKKLIENYNDTGLFDVHGDFHANNILIKNGKCKIIDFENTRKGMPEIELAYIYAQIKILVRDSKEIINQMDGYIENSLFIISDMGLFRYCADIYYKSIKLNHRFY